MSKAGWKGGNAGRKAICEAKLLCLKNFHAPPHPWTMRFTFLNTRGLTIRNANRLQAPPMLFRVMSSRAAAMTSDCKRPCARKVLSR
jgi:hypothetical protein